MKQVKRGGLITKLAIFYYSSLFTENRDVHQIWTKPALKERTGEVLWLSVKVIVSESILDGSKIDGDGVFVELQKGRQ